MSITLEQVDQVIERTNVSYQKAKEVLEKTDGDVLEAIVLLESEHSFSDKFSKNVGDFGNEVIRTLKDLLNSGKVNRIVVEQKDGKTIMNIPVTVGALGAFFLTSATVVGLVAALATGCIIKIHKDSGEIVNVNEMASEMFDATKENVSKVYDKTKSKAEEVKHTFTHEDKKVNVEITEEDDELVVEITEEEEQE